MAAVKAAITIKRAANCGSAVDLKLFTTNDVLSAAVGSGRIVGNGPGGNKISLDDALGLARQWPFAPATRFISYQRAGNDTVLQ
jgi:hypothetical protein